MVGQGAGDVGRRAVFATVGHRVRRSDASRRRGLFHVFEARREFRLTVAERRHGGTAVRGVGRVTRRYGAGRGTSGNGLLDGDVGNDGLGGGSERSGRLCGL